MLNLLDNKISSLHPYFIIKQGNLAQTVWLICKHFLLKWSLRRAYHRLCCQLQTLLSSLVSYSPKADQVLCCEYRESRLQSFV